MKNHIKNPMHTARRRFAWAAAMTFVTLSLCVTSLLPAHAQNKTLKVGLLVPGSVSEEGWNRVGYDALKGVEAQLGAQISYVELEHNPAAFEKAFRDYASAGFDIIIGHGSQFQDAALDTAADYPNTWFLISSSYIHEGRVIGLNTDTSQPFYLMGVIAARMGKGAGLIGGVEIPPIRQAFLGFKNGAKSINPNFPVNEIYIGNSGSDTVAVKEAALSLIAQGADFIIPNATGATVGGYQAVAEAGAGVYSFSIYGDYTPVAPNNILGKFINHYAPGVVDVVRRIRAGNPPASNVVFGLKDTEVVTFDLRDDVPTPVPAAIRAEVQAIWAKIVAGDINTEAK